MINKQLYFICAFGGIALYLAFYSILYSVLKKPMGIQYYTGGDATVTKEQSQAVTSTGIGVALLVVYFIFRSQQTVPMGKGMYFFVFLVSVMLGRKIFPLINAFILPAGIYEQGIITNTSLVRYQNIKSYEMYDSNRKSDKDILYLRLQTSNFKIMGGNALPVDREDKSKVMKIMQQRMNSNKLYK